MEAGNDFTIGRNAAVRQEIKPMSSSSFGLMKSLPKGAIACLER